MSGPSPEERLEARRWLGEADEEIVIARILAADSRAPARAACFHAHLAAEKAIKAVLIWRGVPLRTTHDLGGLAIELPPDDQPRFVVDDLKALNPWTIEGRYPANLADAAPDRVTAVVTAAERVVAAATDALD